jgi:amidohydrolase
MNNLLHDAQELFPYTRSLRRDFHMHPEMGFHEVRTAGIVARELSQLGLEVTTGIAETGVVAMMEGAHPGPVALLRFDMDALPILEETGAEYASLNPGVMHACGHDAHTAVGLTVARLLNERRSEMHGAVKFVFQPAEEGQGGAARMVAEGIMQNPKVDYTLGMHVWNEKPAGWIGVSPGPLMAGADLFEIKVEGKGGHGALPQVAVDPIMAAAHIILALQTIVSRNVSPLEAAVVTVGWVKAGEAFNVIPQVAELGGTIRWFDPKIRELLIRRMEEIVQSVATAMNCKASLMVKVMTTSLINHPQITAVVRETVQEVLPGAEIVDDYRVMGSEDMAYIIQEAPGCFVFVGSANEAKGLNYGHHHPKFDIDEDTLPGAAALMAATALKLLK